VVRRGDIILAVGSRKNLERFRVIVGRESDINLMKAPGRVVSRKIVVTHNEVLGSTIDELQLDERHGVTVTRVTRADIEMTALPELRLQFGDMLQVVGDEQVMQKVGDELGNCVRALNETNFIPIFVGIALGVLAGTLPLSFSGMPVPVRLGLAGGPLVLAILLSRIGRIGPLVWYMPANANMAFRELGIVLFLACVGLKAGEKFFGTVFTAEGLRWLLAGACITVLPVFLVGLGARLLFKLNFTAISGLLAGSMTDPPVLAFANAVSRSDAPVGRLRHGLSADDAAAHSGGASVGAGVLPLSARRQMPAATLNASEHGFATPFSAGLVRLTEIELRPARPLAISLRFST
jgi:putative transport protein